MTGHVPRVKARLSLHAHRRVRGHLEGEYASAQVGRSMDFNDLREYVRGDDVKDLDWKASARTGQMLVKRFVAQRKHTVLLAVSTGREMAAANAVGVPKRDLAVFTAGLVGWLAVRHGDLVALAHGDAETQAGERAAGGELHLERCLGAVHDATTTRAAACDLPALLRHVARTVRRRTLLLVVCDDTEATPALVSALRRMTAQHEVLMITIGDLDPTVLPAEAAPALDLGRGRLLPSWVRGDDELAQQLAETSAAESRAFRETCASLGVVHEHVSDEAGALAAVGRLLERQRHARRR
ncbi:hypothetical protein NOK12_12200 [Nocardioides sp. OK12]|uniref:DUF58 domain-containing protein n=1 Tax=Nocardioides sp. OK12 TaxID=2758661 RepID=UPI0021C34888|nr:DUF58 domain-containing protein [Nocardioides sp. OK12]GHJ58702.1 hypothetical protein NOK12_12200 [Nocardioides sp. OK12]